MSLTHRIQILDFISKCRSCTRLWSPAWWFEKFSSLHLLRLFYLIMVMISWLCTLGSTAFSDSIVLEMAKILWYWFLGNRWCVVMVLIWNFEGFRKILLFNSIFGFLPDGFHHWGGYCGARIVSDTLQILRVLTLETSYYQDMKLLDFEDTIALQVVKNSCNDICSPKRAGQACYKAFHYLVGCRSLKDDYIDFYLSICWPLNFEVKLLKNDIYEKSICPKSLAHLVSSHFNNFTTEDFCIRIGGCSFMNCDNYKIAYCEFVKGIQCYSTPWDVLWLIFIMFFIGYSFFYISAAR